ncbi:MAG TPA: molybdate ABC transporter substrate-binding protein [Bryobacteraceae bacterium]|nr:molybdate ABC transporter substrate-binding protein [Bryobacteraceae bacterium]
MRRRSVVPGFALLLLLCGCAGRTRTETTELTASVAASLQNTMVELAPAFQRSHPNTNVTFNFGGSGTLAQQIEHGAPADIFLAAAPKPMDQLAAKGLLMAGTRRDLLRNEVVLIAPQDNSSLTSFDGLRAPAIRLIALGDPGSVPAGDYGRQALTALHLWDAVQRKLVLAKDVEQVLTYVETGEADAGLVYATDARQSHKVRVVETAPAASHAPVIYPVAVLHDSRNAAAARLFTAFLAGPEARAIYVRRGFTPAFP